MLRCAMLCYAMLCQVVEAALSFAFPWAAYYAAEGMALSGIVSILFCGIMMGLYARPGLSPAAAQLTHDLYATLAKVAETFVFNYIGMAFVTFPIFNPTVWRLACATLLACFVGRLHVFAIAWLINLHASRDWRLRSKRRAAWRDGRGGASASGAREVDLVRRQRRE